MTTLLPVLLLIATGQQSSSAANFARSVTEAQAAERYDEVKALFGPELPVWVTEKSLRGWKAEVMQAPPGYGSAGEWMVFSRHHGPEEDGDHVHPLMQSGETWQLGKEIPEDVATPFTLDKHAFEMTIQPATQIVNITDKFVVKGRGDALLMRLSPSYRITEARIGSQVVQPVRAGSLFWLPGKGLDGQTVTLRYSGKITGRGERAGPDAAFLTAYWWPNIGRRPARHEITMHVPANWIAIGQGEMVSEQKSSTSYTVTWRNDVPVCFFTVCAGPFVIGAETKDDKGRVFRSYMMPDKVDAKRAAQIVDDCKQATNFFEERLGKFPYTHYDCVDSPGYYGLEAYSFTILTPEITLWAPTHEIGHTYFGGIVPNPYLHSIWNESFTQYLDSVLFLNNKDRSLSMGRTNRHGDALASIRDTSHRSDNEGYMRGALVLHMLETEMGTDEMVRCLRQFVDDRRGKVSDWADFQAAVRKRQGKKHDWFFDQWVYSGKSPLVEIVSAIPSADGKSMTVKVKQDAGYRLKFAIECRGDATSSTPVEMTQAEQVFTVPLPVGTTSVVLNVSNMPARTGKAVTLPNGG